MKHRNMFAIAALALSTTFNVGAETLVIDGNEHEINTMLHRDIGPGMTYNRYRIPTYPLNVNVVTVDLTNPYVRIEEMAGKDHVGSTEGLVAAAKRYTTPEKRALAGANANFWCVSSQQPWADLLVGAPFGGTVRNGVIVTETNYFADQWGGGPAYTGVAAVDEDNNFIIDNMWWRGYAVNERIGSAEFMQVNKVVRDGEIGYYNEYYGRDKKFQPVDQYYVVNTPHWQIVEGVSTEVYLTIDEGQVQAPGRDYVCTVGKVVADAGTGTLGDYDIALVARGAQRANLAQLQPGDKVTISQGWTSFTTGARPVIQQMVTTLRTVMSGGVMGVEANAVDYNSMVYSRTGYGTSADGKTLYMIVIDKSTDPVYGVSAGCPTSVMCQIAMYLGCVNLGSCDAGGSAQLFVTDRVVNKTTESSPRAVSNGMFAFSIAPQSDEITRIEFDDVEVTVPIYSASSPRIIGYNCYGDIVTDNVEGITWTCDEAIGHCDGGLYYAASESCTGTLTAWLGDVSVSKQINVVGADIAIKLRGITIDGTRQYPVEVSAMIGSEEFAYDPKWLDWTIDDASIATIDADGVLAGVANGTTTVRCTLGDFTDEVPVTVEIAPSATLEHAPWSTWTAKGASGMSSVGLSAEGLLAYTYGSPRDPSLTLSNNVSFYGVPDAITMAFTSDVDVESVTIDLRTRQHSRPNVIILTGEADAEGNPTAFAAGERHDITFPIAQAGDPAYLGTYPLTLGYVKFTVVKDNANRGAHQIALEPLTAHYDNYAGVESVAVAPAASLRLTPGAVVAGSTVAAYVAGMTVDGLVVTSISGATVAAVSGDTFVAPAPGMYIVSARTQAGILATKMIVK